MTIVAPVTGSCASCFYGQTATIVDGVATMRLCRLHNPQIEPPHSGRHWPTVLDTDWCGDGVDMTSYGSFSPTTEPPVPPAESQAASAAEPVWIAPNPNAGGTLTHLTGSAGGSSTLIRSGAGWITGISVNAVATGSATMTCYDGIDATGTVIAVIDVSRSNPSPQSAAPWGFQTGFFVVLSNGTTGADITIVSHST